MGLSQRGENTKMVNSKQKGSAYERQVCKQLSGWVTGGARSDVFWRSAMSGGRATITLASAQAGDISAVHPLGHVLTEKFIIECKHVRDLNIQGLFFYSKAGINDYWQKLLADCNKYGKLPMLIAKQNRQFPLLFLEPTGEKIFAAPNSRMMNNCKICEFKQYYLRVFRFEQFLNDVNPAGLR